MEFTINAKRENAGVRRGSKYDDMLNKALSMEAEEEMTVAKNGKENLRCTLYQRITKPAKKGLPCLALAVSEDKDNVYVVKLDAPYEVNSRD